MNEDWQPIETAPEETDVLICGEDYRGFVVITGGRQDKYGWDVLGAGGYECETEVEPTHWMPRPAPPNSTPPEET